MTASRLFSMPRQRRRRPAPGVCLGVEVLEDRTTPAAMPLASPGSLAGLAGTASGGVLQGSAQTHGSVQNGPMVQALLRQASQSLSVLSSNLASIAVQINGLAASNVPNPQQQLGSLLVQLQGSLTATAETLNSVASRLSALAPGGPSQEARVLGSVLRGYASSLGVVSIAVNDLAASLPPTAGPLPSPTGTLPTPVGTSTTLSSGLPSPTTTLFTGLLTGLARNTRALARSLNVLAGTPSPTTTQVTGAVLVGTSAGLGNVALSLNAFAITQSGATAAASGNGSPLLLGSSGTTSPLFVSALLVLDGTLGTVENSLSAVAGVLPTSARLSLGSARPLLRLAFTDVAARLNIISVNLGFIGGSFSGALATSLGSVFLTVGVPGGSLGTTSLTIGTLFGDVAGSLRRLTLSLDTLGRSLPGLTAVALVRVTGIESNLLGSAAADLGQLARDLALAQLLLGLTPGFPISATPANGPQAIDALFVTATQNLDLVSTALLGLVNGT